MTACQLNSSYIINNMSFPSPHISSPWSSCFFLQHSRCSYAKHDLMLFFSTSTMKTKPLGSRNVVHACNHIKQVFQPTLWQGGKSSTQTYLFYSLFLPSWSFSDPCPWYFSPLYPHNRQQGAATHRGCLVPCERGSQRPPWASQNWFHPAQTPVGTNPLFTKTMASWENIGCPGWNLFLKDAGSSLGTLLRGWLYAKRGYVHWWRGQRTPHGGPAASPQGMECPPPPQGHPPPGQGHQGTEK